MENVGLNFFYNRKGKPEFSWFKVWDPDKYRFSRGKRVKFQYTSADLVSKEEIDIFDTISDNWKANQVVSYQYNEDRLLEVQQVKVWKDSGFWRDSLKITYSYNNQLQNISILQEKFNDNDFGKTNSLPIKSLMKMEINMKCTNIDGILLYSNGTIGIVIFITTKVIRC